MSLLGGLKPDSKIFDSAKSSYELVEYCRQLKYNGETIVLTNGCFDLLHFGHVSYLNKASEFGDRLIVIMNDDKSVEKLKGKGRPVYRQKHRDYMVASLECVDIVYVNPVDPVDESTDISGWIEKIVPDVYVKGADKNLFTMNQKERKSAGKAGSRIEFVETGYYSSTTSVINYIKNM